MTTGKTIVVTGMSGRLGRLLVKVLHREGTWRILGVDRRPCPGLPPDVTHLALDLRSKRTGDLFRRYRPEALVHLGLLHDPRRSAREHHQWNVEATSRLLSWCTKYGTKKVVFLSTHTVYGARPENPQFLTEEAPLLGAQDTPEMRDLVEADMLVSSFFWKHQDMETVILRPVHVLGRVANAISTYFRLKRVPVLLGFDPMMQFIHEEDVAAAIRLALEPGMRGIFNLPGPGEIPLSAALRELGKPTYPVPHLGAVQLFHVLWKLGLSPFHGGEVNHLRYVCMVDGRRSRQVLGFSPKFNLRETLRAALDPPPAAAVERADPRA